MCGIAGFFQRHSNPERERTIPVLQAMRQRGPNDSGVYADADCFLCHTRLSIQDPAASVQPMFSPDGRYVLVYNGEIFHYREIRTRLLREGVEFRTNGDSEVLLHLLIRHGQNALRQLNGFFAFAFYDKQERILLVARDHLGIKPLFYTWNPKERSFAFASRLDALRLCTKCSYEINPDALAEFLCFQYIGAPRSIYSGVCKLEPGCLLELDLNDGNAPHVKQWNPFPGENENEPITCKKAVSQLRDTLEDAVAQRLIADVPTGVFLSGGLDSCIIAALAAKVGEKPVDCYGIGFQNPRYDESANIRRNAAHLEKLFPGKIKLHLKQVSTEDYGQLLHVAKEFGEPYADASMLPCAILSEYAKQEVSVVLSGDGADELFGGYERYRVMKLLSKLPQPPQFLLSRVLSCIPSGGGERSVSGRLRRFLRLMQDGRNPSDVYDALMSHFITQDLKRIAPDLPLPHHPVPELRDFIQSFMTADLRHYLPGDILAKTDVASMASSLEVRSPFLDHRIVNLSFAMPSSFKCDGKRRKKILLEAFADLIPPELATQRKSGFGVPIADWLRTRWRTQLQDAVHDVILPEFACFSREETERVLQEHFSGKSDHSYLLFSLLVLAIWKQSIREIK